MLRMLPHLQWAVTLASQWFTEIVASFPAHFTALANDSQGTCRQA